MRLAFVVPRYGAEIVGGAETLARELAEHVVSPDIAVEVLTTRARSHHTWANELPGGVTNDGDVRVRRFPIDARNLEPFIAAERKLAAHGKLDLEEELAWVANGPRSEALFEHLAERSDIDVFLFLPYLFPTTLLGLEVVAERAVMIPCLHDEPYATTELVRHAFARARGVFFNSEPERDLAVEWFGDHLQTAPVVGMGFDLGPPSHDAVAGFRSAHGIEGDYLLYFGRKEGGKNLPLLLDQFGTCRDAGQGLSLVVAGDGRIENPPPGVIDLARVSEADKRAACAGALALCQPSTNESFSIVILESWIEETPVIVNAACPVTRHHAERSNAGFAVRGRQEFAGVVDHLRAHPIERRAIGRRGRAYVEREYAWPRVLERFHAALRRTFEEAA